jgi:hypothetical protein
VCGILGIAFIGGNSRLLLLVVVPVPRCEDVSTPKKRIDLCWWLCPTLHATAAFVTLDGAGFKWRAAVRLRLRGRSGDSTPLGSGSGSSGAD